jgi:hypothetical protein
MIIHKLPQILVLVLIIILPNIQSIKASEDFGDDPNDYNKLDWEDYDKIKEQKVNDQERNKYQRLIIMRLNEYLARFLGEIMKEFAKSNDRDKDCSNRELRQIERATQILQKMYILCSSTRICTINDDKNMSNEKGTRPRFILGSIKYDRKRFEHGAKLTSKVTQTMLDLTANTGNTMASIHSGKSAGFSSPKVEISGWSIEPIVDADITKKFEGVLNFMADIECGDDIIIDGLMERGEGIISSKLMSNLDVDENWPGSRDKNVNPVDEEG